jgi:hypothetical protein
MLSGIVRASSSFFVLSAAIYIPLLLLAQDAYPWHVSFFAFFGSVFLFTIAWCSGLMLPVKYAALSALLGRVLFYALEHKIEIDWRLQTQAFLVLSAFVFLTKSKLVSNHFNTYKCVVFDWLVIAPFFPICGFIDVWYKTDSFFYVLGYFCGANIFGLATVYVSSLVWNNIAIDAVSPSSAPTSTVVLPPSSSPAEEQQQGAQNGTRSKSDKKASAEKEPAPRPSKQVVTITHDPNAVMQFIHLYTITRGTHALVGFTELLLSLWTLALFLGLRIHAEGWVAGSVASWQLAFAVGAFSTITSYLGVISSGAALTDKELEYVKDIVPKNSAKQDKDE